jgi:hypothetical protein
LLAMTFNRKISNYETHAPLIRDASLLLRRSMPALPESEPLTTEEKAG